MLKKSHLLKVCVVSRIHAGAPEVKRKYFDQSVINLNLFFGSIYEIFILAAGAATYRDASVSQTMAVRYTTAMHMLGIASIGNYPASEKKDIIWISA